MNPVSIESGSANRRPYRPHYCTEEIAGVLGDLKPELRCLINDFRDFCWSRDGLLDDEVYLWNLAKKMGWSRYRFNRLWPEARQFFVRREKFLFSIFDEEFMIKNREISAKRRVFGSLGGRRKHEKWEAYAESRLAKATHTTSTCNFKETTTQAVDELPPPPPDPPTPREVEEEVSPPVREVSPAPEELGTTVEPQPELFPNQQTAVEKRLNPEEYQAFVTHCANVVGPDQIRGVGVPSRDLCRRLKAKFPGVPLEKILESLPRFAGQNSPGLWDSITRENLELEALRQRADQENPYYAPSKPTQKELKHREWLQMRRQRNGGNQ